MLLACHFSSRAVSVFSELIRHFVPGAMDMHSLTIAAMLLSIIVFFFKRFLFWSGVKSWKILGKLDKHSTSIWPKLFGCNLFLGIHVLPSFFYVVQEMIQTSRTLVKDTVDRRWLIRVLSRFSHCVASIIGYSTPNALLFELPHLDILFSLA